MAFPTTPVLDNFNRADGALGANWSVDPFDSAGTIATVVSNQMHHSSGDFCSQWWTTNYANTGGLEVYLTIIALPATGSGNGFYPGLIQQPSAAAQTADGYQIGFLPQSVTDTISIFRYTNVTTAPTIASGNLPSKLAINDVIGFEVKTDGTINAYKNGTLVLTTNDVTYFHAGESAFPALDLVSNTPVTNPCIVDNFGGGQTVGGGSPLTYDQDKQRRVSQAVKRAAYFMLGDKWDRHGKTSLLVPPRRVIPVGA